MHVKKTPLRKCTGCGEMKPKKELVRVVKSPEGEVSLDLTGRKPVSYTHLDVYKRQAEDLRAMYRRLEEGAQFGEWIGKIRRAAGGYSWTKITYASIFDDSGRPVRAVGVSEDIDQKMREDREIRRKIAAATSFDLEASAELSPDTAWLLDQAPEIVYVSDPVTYDMLYMNAAGLAAIGLSLIHI